MVIVYPTMTLEGWKQKGVKGKVVCDTVRE